jgi:hypothetical protein
VTLGPNKDGVTTTFTRGHHGREFQPAGLDLANPPQGGTGVERGP